MAPDAGDQGIAPDAGDQGIAPDAGDQGMAPDAGQELSAAEVREGVRAGGLLGRDRPVVVMLSGGRDSVCLLDLAVTLSGAERVSALHVNYGLRAEADEDQRHCEAFCQGLGVPLEVLRPERSPGNLQAWAREVRYAAAFGLAEQDDALVAVGHTATDQVETILYRLAASPGGEPSWGCRLPRDA